MALLYENFESYAVGAFAITNWDNFFNLARVVAGGMATGTKGLGIGGSDFNNSAGTITAIASYSVWWWQQLVNGPGAYAPLTITNGVNGPELFKLFIEFDQTVVGLAGGLFLGSSANALELGADFFQVNVTFSNSGGFVNVVAEVALNGVSILSGSKLTTISVAGLSGGVIAADTFVFSGPGNFTQVVLDEITIDVFTTIGTFPNPGVPVVRASQAVIETIDLPSDGDIRVSQGAIEVNLLPSTGFILVSQAVIELIKRNGSAAGNTRIYEA